MKKYMIESCSLCNCYVDFSGTCAIFPAAVRGISSTFSIKSTNDICSSVILQVIVVYIVGAWVDKSAFHTAGRPCCFYSINSFNHVMVEKQSIFYWECLLLVLIKMAIIYSFRILEIRAIKQITKGWKKTPHI